jgi:hypothetical protein
MLTPENRAELEALGAETVRAKLIQGGAGRGAALSGFKTGKYGDALSRGDVEDWLAEKHVEEARLQLGTYRWAKIAALVGIAGLIIAAISLAVTIWPNRKPRPPASGPVPHRAQSLPPRQPATDAAQR